MGRGVLDYGLVRTEQIQLEQRTSDPANPEPNEEWLRVDIKPSYVDANGNDQTGVAEYRVTNTDGSVTTAPVAQVGDATEPYVVDKRRAYVDAGGSPSGVGFIPYATAASGEAAYPARRLEHPVEGRLQMHNAIAESAIPDSGVSRYEFEQDVTDSWGDNDGTDNSSAGYTTDAAVGGHAKSFVGSDGYVDLPITLSQHEEFSVAVWAHPTDDTLQRLISESAGGGGYALQPLNNAWQFFIYDGGDIVAVEGNTINVGAWAHVVGVKDTSEIRLYVDGGLEDTTSITGITESTQNVRIGSGQNERYWNGNADDLRTYSKSLSDGEVSSLYSTGSI